MCIVDLVSGLSSADAQDKYDGLEPVDIINFEYNKSSFDNLLYSRKSKQLGIHSISDKNETLNESLSRLSSYNHTFVLAGVSNGNVCATLEMFSVLEGVLCIGYIISVHTKNKWVRNIAARYKYEYSDGDDYTRILYKLTSIVDTYINSNLDRLKKSDSF